MNLQYASAFAEIADTISLFPVISEKNYKTVDKLQVSLPESMLGNIPVPHDGLSVNYRELRHLVQIVPVDGEKNSFGHVTSHYITTSEPIGPITSVQLDLLNTKSATLIIPGVLVQATSGDNKISLAMPLEVVAGLHVHPDQDMSTHITMSAGIHAPLLMRSVATAIRNGETSISLPHKKGNITYELMQLSEYPTCTLRFHGVFCM